MYATNCGLASSWIPSLEEDGKVKDLPVSLSALRGSVLALHKSAPQQRRGTQLTLDAHLVVPERPGLLPVAAHAEAPLDGAEPDHSEALPARATPPFSVFNAANSLAISLLASRRHVSLSSLSSMPSIHWQPIFFFSFSASRRYVSSLLKVP